MSHALLWTVTAATILLILARPKQIPEAVWAVSGAFVLMVCGLITPRDALAAAGRGADVYLFLTGMMILAGLAQLEGFFDWVAAIAVQAAAGSATRLFAIVYVVGIAVTVFLSNDATAVVLTPAVLAALKKARAKPLPYLLICAFIANAASFVLPISNPANLVIYGSKIPPLGAWFRSFALPSLAAIAVTFAILRFAVRADLKATLEPCLKPPPLSPAARRTAYGIAGTGIALMLASAFHRDLGLPTFLAAIVTAALVSFTDRRAPRRLLHEISWTILPLVAGLFILVAAVDQAGALALSQTALRAAARLGPAAGGLCAAFGVAFLSNVANNLPVGLLAGSAIHAVAEPGAIKNAVLIGVDLGPNLSVTGSLATILWLVALRRAGEHVTFWTFMRFGILVTPPALAVSVLTSLLTSS